MKQNCLTLMPHRKYFLADLLHSFWKINTCTQNKIIVFFSIPRTINLYFKSHCWSGGWHGNVELWFSSQGQISCYLTQEFSVFYCILCCYHLSLFIKPDIFWISVISGPEIFLWVRSLSTFHEDIFHSKDLTLSKQQASLQLPHSQNIYPASRPGIQLPLPEHSDRGRILIYVSSHTLTYYSDSSSPQASTTNFLIASQLLSACQPAGSWLCPPNLRNTDIWSWKTPFLLQYMSVTNSSND